MAFLIGILFGCYSKTDRLTEHFDLHWPANPTSLEVEKERERYEALADYAASKYAFLAQEFC